MNRIALLRALVGLVPAIALSSMPVNAELALNVQPARLELEAAPGLAQTVPLTIRNGSSDQVHVVASLSDFSIDPTGQYTFLPAGKGPYSAAKWASINPREFDIQPNTTVQVRFTVTVPHGAIGEYRALVFFATRPPRKPGALAISEKVASRMYVLVRDTAKVSGDVARVATREVAAARAYEVTFKNSGNAHVYTNGYVEIKSGSSLVDRVKLPTDEVVERDGSRTFTVYGKPLSAGSYAATAVVDFGGDSRVGGQTTFVVH